MLEFPYPDISEACRIAVILQPDRALAVYLVLRSADIWRGTYDGGMILDYYSIMEHGYICRRNNHAVLVKFWRSVGNIIRLPFSRFS